MAHTRVFHPPLATLGSYLQCASTLSSQAVLNRESSHTLLRSIYDLSCAAFIRPALNRAALRNGAPLTTTCCMVFGAKHATLQYTTKHVIV